MAGIGAKKPTFAPFSGEEPASGLPTYGEGVVLGKLVRADVSITYAEGELYADDELAESAKEFVNADIAIELGELDAEKEAALFGSTLTEQEIADNVKDEAPFGGLGYHKTIVKNGKRYHKAYFYPKVRASLGNDNAQTKGSSVTFTTTPLSFKVFQAATGDWRFRETFETEAEADAWIAEKIKPTA